MKLRAVEYKGGKCQVCGYDRSVAGLDFHHRDPTQKDFGIASSVSYGWEKIRTEIEKCDLLCKCCHAEEHERLQAERIKPQQELMEEFARKPFAARTCDFCQKAIKIKKRYAKAFCGNECRNAYFLAPAQLAKQGRVGWPDDESLAKLLWEFSLTALGKQLGVTANAVRKRARKLGLPTPGWDYWSKKRNGVTGLSISADSGKTDMTKPE